MYSVDHRDNPPAYTIQPLPTHDSLPPYSEQRTEKNINQSPHAVTPPSLNEPLTGTNHTSISEQPVHYTDNHMNLPAYSVQLPSQHEVLQHSQDFLPSSPQSTLPAERNFNLTLYPTTSSPVQETQRSSNYPSRTQQVPHRVLLADAGTQYGPTCQNMECPHCRQQVITRVKAVPSETTHLYAFILFLFVCPLFWLPYCMSNCQNRNHFCPNCGAYLGSASHTF